jgi:hypothetical protein
MRIKRGSCSREGIESVSDAGAKIGNEDQGVPEENALLTEMVVATAWKMRVTCPTRNVL